MGEEPSGIKFVGYQEMRDFIVKYLCCPQTGAPLRLEAHRREDDHVVEGELVNVQDPIRRYPIRGGIPRFVAVDGMDRQQRATVETFAYKWSRIPAYAHEQATKTHRERWYFERFNFSNGDEDVRAFLSSARYGLEAGTGTGVDTDLLARNFDGLLFGVDISSAIDIAYERFRENERIALLQADIGQLPFPASFFDFISCDQVLHHTPDPINYFKRLVGKLQPGGKIILYVYSLKGPLREFADDYLRGIYTKAPFEACTVFSEKMARLGRNLSHLRAKVEIEDDIPELGIRRGVYDIQRLIYDHVLKCFWNDSYDFVTNVMINFDWYRPVFAFRYREEDVRAWCREEGLEMCHLQVSPSGISAIMRKAAI
jgi:SAM-dependent methyltransferase